MPCDDCPTTEILDLAQDTSPEAASGILCQRASDRATIYSRIDDLLKDILSANGDLLMRNSAGNIVRIPKGTAEQVLSMNAGATEPEWDDALGVGKQTVWISASGMTPTTTNGCGSLTQVELAAGDDINVLPFDDAADEHAFFEFAFPKKWNEGTVTFQVWWTSTAADTDGVAWALQAKAKSDGDAIAGAFGTAQVVTDDAQGTSRDQYITSESAAITIGGTPAEGDIIYWRIFRDVSDANDDMVEDAELIGIKILYTSNAGTDD